VFAPLVSCVMLVTWPKRAAMIADACAAYDAQTWPRRELVVVNDGAPLRSLRDDVRVLGVPRMTLGEKRNAGADAARGEWIATWDDDDVSLPDRLAVLLRRAQATGAAAVRAARMGFADADLRVRGVVDGACYATWIVRADAWRRVGGCPALSYAEDMELWLRLGLRGLPTARVSDLIYVVRRHAANATNGRTSLERIMAERSPADDREIPGLQAEVDAVVRAPRARMLEGA
jgi:glycosyltransferase involved in cell wall biosynthesis